MSVKDKATESSEKLKVKKWYWSVLILGSVMVVGGIVWMAVK